MTNELVIYLRLIETGSEDECNARQACGKAADEIERLHGLMHGLEDQIRHCSTSAIVTNRKPDADPKGNLNYWQHMHQWGQDSEYHYYQSCPCARCYQHYQLLAAQQRELLAKGETCVISTLPSP